jgi:hypothetical protein
MGNARTPTQELQRLIRKYGRETVAAAASKVRLRKRGRPARGVLMPRLADLSAAHEKILARHVRMAGRKQVARAAMEIELPELGRPAELSYLERMHLASCLDEWAEEGRRTGVRSPMKEAERLAVEQFGLAAAYDKPPDYELSADRFKKLRLQGRRELRELLAAHKKRDAWLRRNRRK